MFCAPWVGAVQRKIDMTGTPISTKANESQSLALLKAIQARLGPAGLLVLDEDKAAYEASARHGGGKARAVARPESADDLSWLVSELVGAGVSFVVQGAATGLVGAGTPTDVGDQWVVSTQRLKDTLEIDPVNRSARVSAGYRLSDLNRAAAEHGLTFPIDLGADPTIGGMVATNTGGARLIRYGGVRENLLAVRGVLANPPGLQVGSSRALRKNNTGLDWTQILTGTFGAFGIVTHATVKLHPVQSQTATALVAVKCPEAAIRLVCSLEATVGELVSAFEGISGNALRAVLAHTPGTRGPFDVTPEYAVLLEISSAVPRGAGLDVEDLLVAWLEARMNDMDIVDAVVDKPELIWRMRHAISESVQALGRLVAFDIAVSRSRFAEFRQHALEVIHKFIPGAQVCDFGHLGDGGLHLNTVVPEETEQDTIGALRDAIYELLVNQFEGSFSAEHGIGPYNQRYYERFTEPAMKSLADVLRGHFDPCGLSGNVQLS